MKKFLTVILCLMFVFSFYSCSGRPYTFDINTDDIKEIYIDLSNGYKVNIESDLWEDFLSDLTALNYKSFVYECRGVSDEIKIILSNDNYYLISQFRIYKGDKKLKYRTNEDDNYLTLLEKYTI